MFADNHRCSHVCCAALSRAVERGRYVGPHDSRSERQAISGTFDGCADRSSDRADRGANQRANQCFRRMRKPGRCAHWSDIVQFLGKHLSFRVRFSLVACAWRLVSQCFGSVHVVHVRVLCVGGLDIMLFRLQSRVICMQRM